MTALARRLVLAALGLVLLGALTLLCLWAVRTAAGQEQDIVLFADAQSANATLAAPASLLRSTLPVALAVVCAVLMTVAVVERRWRSVLASAALVGTAALAARWLRTVLERPYLGDHGYLENTFPSGHVAVTTALVVAAVLLWPASSRRAPAVVAPVVVAIACVVSVVGHAHRPSDVVGAVLLALGVACLASSLCDPSADRQER